jgi:hypothetical protein
MKKFSIIINSIGDKYAIVLSSWIEVDGQRTDEKSITKIDLTFDESLGEVHDFIKS